jgi:hypothetical protein
MKNIFSILAVVLMAVTLAPAQANFEMMRSTSQPTAPQAVVTGYLLDAKCATANPNRLTTVASSHTTACAIGCPTGEYGVVWDGLWVPFDEKSSKKVAKLLSKTSTEKGLRVTAKGTLNGEILTVSSLKEVKPSDE